MRIVRIERRGSPVLGVRIGEKIVDLSAAAPHLPTDMTAFLALGNEAMETARAAAAAQPAKATFEAGSLHTLPLLSLAERPGKIICLGMNYADHAAEAGRAAPEFPVIFYRGGSSLIGHNQPIVRPKISNQLDFEGELVAYIGRTARHLSRADALSAIAGYSVFNDGSIRDYQRRTTQWTLGKNFDGTGAIGPEFVSADELPAGASGLRLQTRLNGQTMQDANTADMVFGAASIVEDLSQCMTLDPGDLIVLGTPAGVGLLRDPPIFMQPGDVCEVEVEGIGVLRNPIVQEL